jgi:cob(I)alamin adenosyltransferase
MKVYTKTGDKGQTSLLQGRVSKSHPRIHIVGMLDKVMVLLGKLMSKVEETELKEELKQIYKVFFTIQTQIVDVKNDYLAFVTDEDIRFLEVRIDEMQTSLPVLKNFIYYGGHDHAILSQELRSDIRTVERYVVELDQIESVNEKTTGYLNRASDYFYTLGRYLNWTYQVEEEIIKL